MWCSSSSSSRSDLAETSLDEETITEFKDFSSSDEEEEFIEMLLSIEISFDFSRKDSVDQTDDWMKTARISVIQWSMEMKSLLGFRLHTVYLCITYFDRFVRVQPLDKMWTIRLLSVACLSLAAKMEEHRLPALAEIQVEEYYFESKVVKRMELLVLNSLEWRMSSVTPFAFIRYFFSKLCNGSLSCNAVFEMIELVLAMMTEVDLVDYKPSAVAAAVALMAMKRDLTRSELEDKISASPCRFLQIEEVFSCYSSLQRIQMEKMMVQSIQSNAFRDSSSCLTVKRRRLDLEICSEK